MTSFPGWGYISGSRRARLCCCYCSVELCAGRLVAGPTGGRTQTLRPASTLQRLRYPVYTARPTALRLGARRARRPGFAMRSAAVLALLLCAGQGERSVGERVPGAPIARTLAALRPGPSVPPLRAASFSTADSAPPPA